MSNAQRPFECDAPATLQAFVSQVTWDREAEGPLLAAPLPSCVIANEVGAGSCVDEAVERGETPPGIRATRNDGFIYPGDLLVDAVTYRSLRAQSLRGQLSSTDEERLTLLESRLRQAPPAQDPNAEALLRAFQRYNCDFPALVVFQENAAGGVAVPRALEVAVRDISAGGIKAVAPHAFSPGEVATLNVIVPGLGDAQVRFPARVAWVTPEAFGLMFAGQAEIRPAPKTGSQPSIVIPRAA